MTAIIESVPNFSCGRDPAVLAKILAPLEAQRGVKVLDYSSDYDHNRSVVTVMGEPEALLEALFQSIKVASELIDLREHQGEHPRMGACDVVPFIPLRNADLADCTKLAEELGERVGCELEIPVYLYESSARQAERKNLAKIRKGQFEGFAEKIQQAEWAPDFGPAKVHPSAGCTAIGARMPLIAFNINLNSSDLAIADAIAKKVRHIGGGLRFVKGMGVELKERGIVQVSMNLVNYEKSAIYQAFEMVKMEAKRYGVEVIGSELIGLAPMQALIDSAIYYLQIENFSADQIIEHRLLEGADDE
ncbi:MAG: glutamate formimidoyltransferase [Eubacteriales bacterium]|nr:glutamate formimidoyltransferase [Eubacteriales bacterium]